MKEQKLIMCDRSDLEQIVLDIIKGKVAGRSIEEKLEDAGIFYITRDQAAQIVGRTEQTLYNWEKQGRLKRHKREDGKLFYLLSEVVEHKKNMEMLG